MKKKLFCLIFMCLGVICVSNAQMVKRPKVTGVAHFALYTSDLENTRSFYKDYLGYEEPYVLYKKDSKTIDMSFIKINDSQLIEIFPEKTPEQERFFHFGIETDDAEGMRKYLESKGVDVPKNTPTGRIGNHNYFVNDYNGTICEIVQYGDNGTTAKNRGLNVPDSRISNRMSHVGFMVADLDLALKFYCDILGFKEVWRGSADNKNTTWVHLQVPEGTDCIELMLYNKELSKKVRGVFNHFCLEVEDVPAAIDRLSKRTIPEGCTHSEFKTGINKKRQINYFDVDGTRVEIMEANTVTGEKTPSCNYPPLKYSK